MKRAHYDCSSGGKQKNRPMREKTTSHTEPQKRRVNKLNHKGKRENTRKNDDDRDNGDDNEFRTNDPTHKKKLNKILSEL